MFKLWDINNKEWVANRNYVIRPNGGYLWRTPDGTLICGSKHKLIRNTFVKDMVGNEIYETDICNFKHNGETHSGIVKFENGAFMINGFMLYEKRDKLMKVGNGYVEGIL